MVFMASFYPPILLAPISRPIRPIIHVLSPQQKYYPMEVDSTTENVQEIYERTIKSLTEIMKKRGEIRPIIFNLFFNGCMNSIPGSKGSLWALVHEYGYEAHFPTWLFLLTEEDLDLATLATLWSNFKKEIPKENQPVKIPIAFISLLNHPKLSLLNLERIYYHALLFLPALLPLIRKHPLSNKLFWKNLSERLKNLAGPI